MMPDLMNLDYGLFAIALVIAAGAVALSRFLWVRVGREDGRKAGLYKPSQLVADPRKYKKDNSN